MILTRFFLQELKYFRRKSRARCPGVNSVRILRVLEPMRAFLQRYPLFYKTIVHDIMT